MTKTSNASKAASKRGKDLPAPGAGYREIGIAAVAAALRFQQMPASDDDRGAKHSHDSGRDPLP